MTDVIHYIKATQSSGTRHMALTDGRVLVLKPAQIVKIRCPTRCGCLLCRTRPANIDREDKAPWEQPTAKYATAVEVDGIVKPVKVQAEEVSLDG
jgi:hypothetical protein